MIVFEMCDRTVPDAVCKDETETKKWLENKYIITVDNIKRFIQHDFNEERIEIASVFKWYPLSPDIRTDTVNMVQRQNMIINDYRFNVGSLLND